MKKNIGVVPAVYPMPVLMVAAYDANEKVNVMNVACLLYTSPSPRDRG